MAEFLSVNLSGDLEVRRALKSLTPALEKKALKTALRTAAKPILATARANAPKTVGEKHPDRPPPGTLKKSIKIRAFKRTRKGRVGFTIGTGSRDFFGKAFYGSFQEYGWRQGKRPWRSHTSAAKRLQRLNESVASLERKQPFLTARQLAHRQKLLAQARSNLVAHAQAEKNDTRRQIPGKFFIRKAFDTHKHATKENLRRLILEAVEKTVKQEAAKRQKSVA